MEVKDFRRSPAPQVDIIVRGAGRTDLLYRLLQSIKENTDPDLYNLIYVDNGTQQGPIAAIMKEFPQHTYILLPFNHGSVRAINHGLMAAMLTDSKFVLILDNDTQIPQGDKTWLERWMKYFDDPQVGAAGAVSSYVAGYQYAEVVPDLYQKDWKVEGEGEGYKDPFVLPVLVSFAVMLRKAAIEKIGVFDEAFDPGQFEDFDYTIRLMMAGFKNVVANSVYIHHVGSQTFGNPNIVKSGFGELLERNQAKFVAKYGEAQLKQWGITS